SLCGIRIQIPDDLRIALYPGFPQPLAEACDHIELASIMETLTAAPLQQLSNSSDWQRAFGTFGSISQRFYRAVPVIHDSERVGIIFSLSCEDGADAQSQQNLLESWS